MSESIIKNRDAVISDGYNINHNFGEQQTLKIVSIKDQVETVLFEIEVAIGRSANLICTITDNEI